MRTGPKPKPAHLQVVAGTFRRHRDRMVEGSAVAPPERPKFLRGRAAKIWDEMVARHPEWTEFQISILATYCGLKAEHESDANKMATARIVEMRRQAELLLAPRGKVEPNGKAAQDPAEQYFGPGPG